MASRNIRAISTGPSPVFAVAVAWPDRTARAAASPVQCVGLAWAPASGAVGPVDLGHGDIGRK
ncbi:hypothetical protein MXD63_32495 [Frankia sp. Cpl3]|nr:hypothetical protein [Frankia sp. Cpl3]